MTAPVDEYAALRVELEEQLREVQRDVAELEARAEAHLDEGRTREAWEVLERAVLLRQHSYGLEFDLVTLPFRRPLPAQVGEVVTR